MWCASGFRARKRPLIRSTLDGYFGSETAGLKRGKRGSWRSFSIDTLSDMAKRPLHHRRVLRGGRSRCCFGGGVDLGGHRADICLRIRNWVRVYLVGTAREAGRTANVSIRSRFARVKPVVDGFAAHAAVRRPSRRAISKFGTDPSCSRSARRGSPGLVRASPLDASRRPPRIRATRDFQTTYRACGSALTSSCTILHGMSCANCRV